MHSSFLHVFCCVKIHIASGISFDRDIPHSALHKIIAVISFNNSNNYCLHVISIVKHLYILGSNHWFEFRNFWKKEGSDFSHKKGGVGKIGGTILKKEGITYFHTK